MRIINRVATTSALALAAWMLAGATCLPSPARAAGDGDFEKALAEIPGYDFGGSWKAFTVVEEELRSAANRLAEVEDALVAALENPEATYASKQRICKLLRRYGTPRCVPALAKLLADEKLSHMARFALQEMDFPQAAQALRQALRGLRGNLAIGVIGSLGARRDARAIPALAKRAVGDNPEVGRAALQALGRIGGPRAARVLATVKVASALDTARDDARVTCADGLLAGGDAERALAIFRDVYVTGRATTVRTAALHGIARAEGARALPLLLGLLKGQEGAMQDAALMFVASIPGEEATQALAGELPALAPGQQIAFLNALAARGDKSAAPAVAKAADSEDEAVRSLAVRTLAALGGAEDVPRLAGLATGEGEVAAAALDALGGLSGPGVDRAIRRTIQQGDAATRVALLPVLVTRQAPASGLLFRMAHTEDAAVRREALDALGALASEKDLPKLIEKVVAAQDDRERKVGERALQVAARRVDDPEQRADYLISAMPEASESGKASLLRVLGKLGGEKAYQTVTAAVKDPNDEVRDAAIRSLAGWPEEAAMPLLLELSNNADSEVHRIQALRGFIRLLGQPSERPIDATLSMYQAAKERAARADEKKMLIAAAAGVEDPKILPFLKAFLEDDSVRIEAGTAVQKISTALGQAVEHAAAGRPVALAHPFSPRYAGGGDGALTDGYRAGAEGSHKRWQGFEGDDLIVTIDLGQEIEVHEVRAGFLEQHGGWIFLPKQVEFSLSKDGESFEKAATIPIPVPEEAGAGGVHDFARDLGGKLARYVRVHAASVGRCPKWHSGGGGKAWVFADEIQVNPKFAQ